jgi:ribonuclease P protein component
MAKRPAAGGTRGGRKLGPAERIRRTAEFEEIYRTARPVHGRMCVAFIAARAEDGERRAGFIAGRRVGDAARRNRAKRVLRAAYRELKPELSEKSFRAVFIARAGCDRESSAVVLAEMRELFQRAGLL